jgi:hypothetical protein
MSGQAANLREMETGERVNFEYLEALLRKMQLRVDILELQQRALEFQQRRDFAKRGLI